MNGKLGVKGAGRLAAMVATTGVMVAIPMAVLAGPALAVTTPGVTNMDRNHHDRDHSDSARWASGARKQRKTRLVREFRPCHGETRAQFAIFRPGFSSGRRNSVRCWISRTSEGRI